MAPYEFTGAEPTIQQISPESVQDAQRVSARAAASGVSFSRLFAPYPTDARGNIVWPAAEIHAELDHWAGIWDTNYSVAGVTGISVSQDVDPAGQLQDAASVVVQSSSGKSTTLLTLPPQHFVPENFAANVRLARAQLDELEAMGS